MGILSCYPGKESAPKVSLSYWISEGVTWSIWGTCRAQPLFVNGKHGVCIIKLFQGFIFSWLSFLQPETHWNHFRSGRQEFTQRSMPQTESLIPDNISTLSALEFSSSLPLCMSSPFLLLFFFWGGGLHWPMWGANWVVWWLSGQRCRFTVTIITNVKQNSLAGLVSTSQQGALSLAWAEHSLINKTILMHS